MLDQIAVPRTVFVNYVNLLRPVDFKVWLHIFYRTQGVGGVTCEDSQQKIAMACGLSIPTTNRAIQRLIRRGFVALVRNHGKNMPSSMAVRLDGWELPKPGPTGAVIRCQPRPISKPESHQEEDMRHFRASPPITLDQAARDAIGTFILKNLHDHLLEKEPLAGHLLDFRKTNHSTLFDQHDFMIWFLEEVWANRHRNLDDHQLVTLQKRLSADFNLIEVLREFRMPWE